MTDLQKRIETINTLLKAKEWSSAQIQLNQLKKESLNSKQCIQINELQQELLQQMGVCSLEKRIFFQKGSRADRLIQALSVESMDIKRILSEIFEYKNLSANDFLLVSNSVYVLISQINKKIPGLIFSQNGSYSLDLLKFRDL